MATNKEHERHSVQSLQIDDQGDVKGKIFMSNAGLFDLSSVNIIHSGVDTIRQLYRGILRPGLGEWLDMQNVQKNEIVEIFGQKWAFGRLAKTSGFRYRIQNNDLGVIMLVGSYYSEIDKTGAHLKIELSPKFILGNETDVIQTYLDQIADWIYGDEYKASGVAVHLACDVQGWEPESTFRANFRTRSRAIQDIDGLSKVEFHAINDITVEYGKKQGYLFGKSTALQMSMYRKDDEIIKVDKVDFWHDRWNQYTEKTWNPDKPVWRIEARIHHNIIREIGIGLGKGQGFEKFSDVKEYLVDIWKYALTSNHLQHNASWVDPFWQLIRSDATFYNDEKGVVIVRKKKEDTEGVGRNYAQIIGNVISVGARRSWKLIDVMLQLKRLEFYDDIVNYYRSHGINESTLRQRIDKALCLRRLAGKAA